jgi:molybdate transport system regulatory protein
MARRSKSTHPVTLLPRLRIISGDEIAFGPGKADLLSAVQRTGSITRAAAELRMSYMRAWTLIRTMNQCFREPLVTAVRGGTKGGGGAQLTDAGVRVLALYQSINEKCLRSSGADWKKLQQYLRA